MFCVINNALIKVVWLRVLYNLAHLIHLKSYLFSDKDIDCDIRENIINYEDEGGGEVDNQNGYDLSVLR